MDCLLINDDGSVFVRNQHVTQNRLSFAGSQILLASENEFNSMGSFNSKGTIGDARRLLFKEPKTKANYVKSRAADTRHLSKNQQKLVQTMHYLFCDDFRNKLACKGIALKFSNQL